VKTKYLVWVDGGTRADADVVEADDGPREAAEIWLENREAAEDWRGNREFRAGDTQDITENVTVVEDAEGAIEERFDVFAEVSVTFTAYKQRVVDVQA